MQTSLSSPLSSHRPSSPLSSHRPSHRSSYPLPRSITTSVRLAIDSDELTTVYSGSARDDGVAQQMRLLKRTLLLPLFHAIATYTGSTGKG